MRNSSINLLYYIHTEKYSPKSYVLNFRTQISLANQRSERWFSDVKKNDTSNQNRERCFFTWELKFGAKIPAFYCSLLSGASHTFNEKSFTQRVFVAKKVKNISEMEWNSFVSFTVHKENGREPAKHQRKEINRTIWGAILDIIANL